MIRIAILAILTLFVSELPKAHASELEQRIDTFVVLEVDASINPAIYNYIKTELERSPEHPGQFFVIKLNTPGGLVSTTKDIITTIGKSPRPVVVWVTPEGASATSAGAIIASGAHGLVMSPGTNIGAATPVMLGEDIKAADGRAKAVNDLSALVKSLSELRGRNADAFAKMIATAASFTSEEAKKQNIIDGIVNSLDDIRALYDNRVMSLGGQKRTLKFAQVVQLETRNLDAGLSLLNIFAHPTTAYILFILGAALLYFEFQAPGGYISGGVGVLCLLLAGIGFQVLPLNMGAILLMVAGFVLLVLEIFITSYGLLALSGIGCLAAGSLFLFRHEDAWLTIQYSAIFSTLAAIVVFIGLIGWYLARHRAQKIDFFSHADQEAEVIRLLADEAAGTLYQVKVHGEIWKARGAAGLTPGTRVKVRKENSQELILEIV
ncbi:MAG: NfeD family protein [Bacteriovoracia bacterium]